jgi:hypothetical protein
MSQVTHGCADARILSGRVPAHAQLPGKFQFETDELQTQRTAVQRLELGELTEP